MLNPTHQFSYVPQSSFSKFPGISHTPKQNRLLALLPEHDYQRLLSHLELVPLSAGTTIFKAGVLRNYAYFPTDSIISLLYDTECGKSSQIAVTGNDGFVGVVIAMGSESNLMQNVVQTSGHAYRLKASVLKKFMVECDAFQLLVLRYTQILLTQIALTAVCNRHHSIEQQFCRWLLLNLDRLFSQQINVTHEHIAHMLGVRREGITQAAQKLQASNAIHYSRGHIQILDRSKLEASVCECYQVFKKETDRLLDSKTHNANQTR